MSKFEKRFVVAIRTIFSFSVSNPFNIEDVAKELKDKLIHRHPHVFGNAHVATPDDVVKAWDRLKQDEKKKPLPIWATHF